MVSWFQNILWSYLTSEFYEDQQLSLPEMCLEFVSWSQLQHKMLDKFNNIYSLKEENIISTLRPIPLIFLNFLKAALGISKPRTVLTYLTNKHFFFHIHKSPISFCSLKMCICILCLCKYLAMRKMPACSCVSVWADIHKCVCVCVLGIEVEHCGIINVAFN